MRKTSFLLINIFISTFTFGQKSETVYLTPKDSTANMYIAVIPETKPIKAFMFLLDGFGNSPKDVSDQMDLSNYAAQQGILTVLSFLKTGSTYFGVDSASQQSLKEQIENVVAKYHLQEKNFYIGGFSIGGSCVVKYGELAVKNNYTIKPKAIFASSDHWQRMGLVLKSSHLSSRKNKTCLYDY